MKKPDCCEPNETTPALSDVEQGGEKNKKKRVTFPGYDAREQKRKEIAERIKREQDQANCKYTCITGSCLVCMIVAIIFSIISICKYYSTILYL